jgi:hydrogenase nickel incorporation protein HypB
MEKTSHVKVVQNIMSANDEIAEQNRSFFDKHRILAINIMASPGSGKTSLILETIAKLSPTMRIGVIEGDTAPVTIDSDKVTAVGIPAVQINTGGNCHLDAMMISKALPSLPMNDLDLVIIENVGNLVCPASFKLGNHVNVVVASIPEGDDKPYKYPAIYQGIDALVLNKTDLLPYITFRQDYFLNGIRILNPRVNFFPLSCKTGEGIDAWYSWILSTSHAMMTHEG